MKLIKEDDIVVDMYILLYAVHDKHARDNLPSNEWFHIGQVNSACKETTLKIAKLYTSILFFEVTYEELLEHYVLEHI